MRKKDKLRRMSTKRRNKEEKERDYRYSAVMRALVWRYVTAMHKKTEENPVTEDDINEVKSDISSFRYELLEVLQKNGMDVSCAEKKEKGLSLPRCVINSILNAIHSNPGQENEDLGKTPHERLQSSSDSY